MGWVDKEKLANYRQNMKQRLLNELKIHNRVGMQEPTAIGKSYMMIDLCKNDFKDYNKVIIEPSRCLADLFEEDVDSKTNVMLYQNLLKLSDINLENMFKNIDFLFLDEVHRAGADKWEIPIKKIFKMFPKMKIIGLSATPERTDGKNMITELFDDVQTEPMNLETAIMEHLLPQIKYVTAFASLDEEIKTREEAIRDSKLKYPIKNQYFEVLKTERHKLESIMNIPKILKKYIDNDKIENKNFKILLFVSRLNQIDEAEQEALKWFNEAFPNKKINFYKLKNGQTRKTSKNLIKNFESNQNENEIDIMISVNKLIEGFHIKKVSCSIFLRRTISKIVFLQQIGRTLSEDNPIIFDFVGNNKNIKNEINVEFKNIKKYSATNKDDRIDEPIIYLNDELLEVEKIFEKISLNKRNFLTEEEKQYIINNCEKLTINEIAKNLNRTREVIKYFCVQNNLKFITSGREYVTKEQENFIIENSYKMTINQMCNELNLKDKQVRSIIERKHLNYVRNKKDNISKNYDLIVKYINEGKSIKEISKLIKCDPSRLRAYIKENNLKVNNKTYSEKITKSQELYIQNNYKTKTHKEIAEYLGFPCHFIDSYCIKNNLRKGRRNIPEEKIKFIIDNCKFMDTNELSNETGIRRRTVAEILKENGYPYKIRKEYIMCSNRRDPSIEEIEYINKYKNIKTVKELAENLKVDRGTLRRWFKDYNINYNNKRYTNSSKTRSISEEQEKFIKNNYSIYTCLKLAEILNIPESTVKYYIRKNNLKKFK